VYALNADTGAVIWKYKTGGPVDSGIVLNRGSSDVDEQLFFGSDDGYVCVLSFPHTLATSLFRA
jgi:outer membrane protein assembly factor BamB